MPRDEALRRARLAFGAIEAIKEESRDRRGVGAIDVAWRDLRYAVRTLARTPAFTVVAILSLTLGIGANTAMFQVLNGLLLRELPVASPQELVEINLPERRSRARARQLPALAGDAVPAVRGAAAAPGGVLDGVRLGRRMVQPRPRRRGPARAGPVGERRLFPGARAHARAGPPLHARRRSSGLRLPRRGRQPRLLAARAGRRSPRDRPHPQRAQPPGRHHRRGAGGLHRAAGGAHASTSRCRSARWSRSGRTARSSRAAPRGGSRRSAACKPGLDGRARRRAPARDLAGRVQGVAPAGVSGGQRRRLPRVHAHGDAGGDGPLVSARRIRDAAAAAARR